MTELIFPGLVAFFTAVAAALIAAVVTPHVKEELRRRATTLQRQRSLIQERLARGRREVRFAKAVGALIAGGVSPAGALDESHRVVGPVFEANDSSDFSVEAIDEGGLRELVREFDVRVNSLLWMSFRATREYGSLERDEFLERLPYETVELSSLESRVIDRMERVLGARATPVNEVSA